MTDCWTEPEGVDPRGNGTHHSVAATIVLFPEYLRPGADLPGIARVHR